MGEKDRQHYVPAMYLRGFVAPSSTQQELFLYEYNKPPRRRAAKSVAWEDCFYDVDALADPKQVEEMLALIESAAGPILKKLASGSINLSAEEKIVFAEFLGIAAVRTPYHRALADHIAVEGQKEITRGLLQEPDVLVKAIALVEKEQGQPLGTDEEKLRDFMARLLSGDVFMKQENRAWKIVTMLRMAHNKARLFVRMRWNLLRTIDPSDRFIATDNPVLAQDRIPPDTVAANYEATRHFQFFFPVNPTYMLMGDLREGGGRTGRIDRDSFRALQEEFVWRAFKQVYASFRSSGLQALMDKLHRGRASRFPPLPLGFLGLRDPREWLVE